MWCLMSRESLEVLAADSVGSDPAVTRQLPLGSRGASSSGRRSSVCISTAWYMLLSQACRKWCAHACCCCCYWPFSLNLLRWFTAMILKSVWSVIMASSGFN